MEKFVCLKCGNTELSVVKWIKSKEKVEVHPDGHIEYLDQQINDNEVRDSDSKFICRTCKTPLFIYLPGVLRYAQDVSTDQNLIRYLNLSIEERRKMAADYEEMERAMEWYQEDRSSRYSE